MGYTHYWEHNPMFVLIKHKNYVQTLRDMAKIVKACGLLLAGFDGTGEPELSDTLVRFNGLLDDAHETFMFSSAALQKSYTKGFMFCKTACKPYDVAVVACLAVAAELLGDWLEVSSDGGPEDWEAGVKLASLTLKRQIPNPIVPYYENED